MSTRAELPILQVPDQAAWERWLEENHRSCPGVWLKLAKKGSPVATVSQPEALEGAICFGWIDGQVGRYDDHFYLQRFTPHRRGSKWSAINRDRAGRLITQGRMRAAGLAEYQAAQADGRLQDAYEPQSKATVPPDFQAALEEHSQAREFFATLTGSDRYAFLYRLHHVKDPARRAQKIAEYVARLSEGRTLRDR